MRKAVTSLQSVSRMRIGEQIKQKDVCEVTGVSILLIFI